MKIKFLAFLIVPFMYFLISGKSYATTADDLKSLGDQYLSQNENSEAKDAYQKALALDPNSASAMEGLGWVYARARNYNMATQELELALKTNKDLSRAILPSLILMYLYENNVKAVDHIKEFLKLVDPSTGKNFMEEILMARYFGIHETKNALSAGHMYKEGSTKRVVGVMKESQPFIKSREFDKVIALYKDFLSTEDLSAKEKALVSNVIGTAYYYDLNDLQSGLSYFRQAVDLDPQELGYKISLTDAYGVLQMYPQAFDVINGIFATDPNNRYALTTQGALYFKEGNWKMAVASWDKLKPVDPILFGLVNENYSKAKSLL